MLRVKLVRTGKKDYATWRVVVVEKTKTGRGRVAEYIGNYNPNLKPKEFNLNVERYEYWVGVGAQPTDMVLRLKGKFIDKNKDYQKVVPTKIYKKKVKKEEETTEGTKKTEDAEKKTTETTDKSEITEQKEEKSGAVEEEKTEDKKERSEERRVGKECRSRWSQYH